MTAPTLRPADVRGMHVGLRTEAADLLASGGIPPAEASLRLQRERAREWGDDESMAMWSRLLWRHYVKARYMRRPRVVAA